ncbi:MAG: (Fe-S)-binding protein [Polyangiales bacterium]
MTRPSLPLLDARRTATTRCTYCPKLCRPACPVGTAEARETATPWGILRALGALTADPAPEAPASHAAAAWSCTGCGGCGTLCLLHNPVTETVWDARRDAHAAGLAPREVTAFREGFDARLARLPRPAGLAEVPAGDGRTVFLPGCSMVARETDAVVPGAHAVAALTGGARVLTGVCCGAPLLDAGDEEAFSVPRGPFSRPWATPTRSCSPTRAAPTRSARPTRSEACSPRDGAARST